MRAELAGSGNCAVFNDEKIPLRFIPRQEKNRAFLKQEPRLYREICNGPRDKYLRPVRSAFRSLNYLHRPEPHGRRSDEDNSTREQGNRERIDRSKTPRKLAPRSTCGSECVNRSPSYRVKTNATLAVCMHLFIDASVLSHTKQTCACGTRFCFPIYRSIFRLSFAFFSRLPSLRANYRLELKQCKR